MDKQNNGAFEKREMYRRVWRALEILKNVKYLFVVNNRVGVFNDGV